MPRVTAKPAVASQPMTAGDTVAPAKPGAASKSSSGKPHHRKRTSRSRNTSSGLWRGWFFLTSVLIAVLLGFGALEWRFVTLKERQREEKLLLAIQVAAACHGLDPALVRAVVWKESRFNPESIGTKGEIGLMQITPGAVQDWARLNRQPVPTQAELFASDKNLMIGCWYLAHCRKHWDGYASQEILQLAEYNAGRTKVLKDWAPATPEETISIENITYPSTRSYIQQILKRRRLYQKEESAVNN